MNMGKPAELELEICDVSGQKVFSVANAPVANTVGELIREVLGHMNLAKEDAGGAPLTYQARLERTGVNLHAAERIGDVLERGDRLTLQPNVDAG
jgi:hypothetical protein